MTWPIHVGYIRHMVNPNMPWSLKGISDEARDYAKIAADGAGVPVGAWLSAVIRAAAQPSAAPAMQEPDIVPRSDSGSTIERAVQIVSDFGFEPEGPARDTDLIEDADLLEATLESLERRIADSESLTAETLAPLEQEIDRIRRRLETLRNG